MAAFVEALAEGVAALALASADAAASAEDAATGVSVALSFDVVAWLVSAAGELAACALGRAVVDGAPLFMTITTSDKTATKPSPTPAATSPRRGGFGARAAKSLRIRCSA